MLASPMESVEEKDRIWKRLSVFDILRQLMRVLSSLGLMEEFARPQVRKQFMEHFLSCTSVLDMFPQTNSSDPQASSCAFAIIWPFLGVQIVQVFVAVAVDFLPIAFICEDPNS